MRVAFFCVALTCASTAIFFACSSSDTPSGSGASDGGGGSSGGNGSDTGAAIEDGGSSTDDDSGVAPDGCHLKTTDFVIGAKAETLPVDGVTNTADWTNVNGALSEDGNFATVTMNDGQQSSELRVSQFNFTVPDTAETWGIEVELKRRAPGGAVIDAKVDLLIDGKQTVYKYFEPGWPTTIVGTHAYGQAVDTWGVDLYPSDVDKPTFAARLTVKRAGDAGAGPITAIVDSMKIAVHFCPVPAPKQ